MNMRFAFAVPLALAAVGLAACGSSSSGSSSSSSGGASTSAANTSSSSASALDQYKKIVEEGQAAVKWNGPSDPAKAPTGKSLTVVTCTQALEGCKLLTAGTVHAAKAVGWKTNVIDVTDPTKYDQALQTAISQGADAIVLVGVDQRLVPGGIKAGHAKKVPLVSLFQNNKPGPNGVDVEVVPDAEREGQLLAASMIVDTGGKVNALVMPDAEFSLPVAVLAAAKKELNACSACTVSYAPELSFTAAIVGTTLPGRVVGELRTHTDVNSILVGFDPPVTQVIPAIASAGLTSKVKFYSQLGTTAALDFIRQKNVMAADVGASNEWGGWGAVDETIRLLNGQPSVDENVPAVLLNSTNLPAQGQPFVGEDAGFKEKYKALWK
jgi:ribose transport system substrate-binding protein